VKSDPPDEQSIQDAMKDMENAVVETGEDPEF
jgi:hypothetical protein